MKRSKTTMQCGICKFFLFILTKLNYYIFNFDRDYL